VSPRSERGRDVRRPVLSAICLVALLTLPRPASAQVPTATETEPAVPLLSVSFVAELASPATPFASETPLLADPAALLPLDGQPTPAATSPAPTLAFEYSEGYRQRARIHRIASFATIPIFATEAIIGQSLYSNPTDAKREAHVMVSGALGGLFFINTVTGVWNLLEARKDPHFGRRKWAHAVLMMGANVGFVASAALAPDSEDGELGDSRAAHRAVSVSAIALATTGYFIMLFGS